ncbi:MAG: hypothetical protein SOY65_10800 [Marinifilaceae bacterium]|nr:hypothetical protein [Marinifilaceae bacterium]
MEEKSALKNKKDTTLWIIIGALAVILIVLSVFFMIEHKENKANMEAIMSEKEVLQQELTDLSHDYDNLRTDNDTLNARLAHEQEKIAQLMESMKKFRNNSYAEINRYKKEIGTLKSVLRSYVVQIDSLNQLNQKLLAENTEVKKQMNWVRERNKTLEQKTEKMAETLEKASTLNVESISVYPINKREKETSLKKCYQLKTEFTIERNITAKRGTKTIYLRFTRPDGQVIAASSKSFFKFQNTTLTYSARREIEYEGERLEVAIYWPNDGSLIRGEYIADLFCDNQQIGTTKFILK